MGALMHHGLEQAAERFGDRAFVRAGDEAWSFRELDDVSNAFARHLDSKGVSARDRVAVMTTNRMEFVVSVHAISKLGAAALLLSPAWKAIEVEHALHLTRPVHAVADGPAVGLLADRVSGGTTDLDDRATMQEAFAHARTPVTGTDIADTDESVLVFSSGTTGLAKAVRHTHRSMVHATAHWCDVLDLGPDDRFQVATPPSHILGLLNLLAAASAGATVRLHPRFDLDEVLRRIETERMTLEMAVAPIALAMANHPGIEDYDLSSLRYIMWGATPVSENVAKVVTQRTGVRWLPAYGASELPVIACNPVREPDRWRLDSAGLPPKGVELRVADLDSGEILPPGETGEIQVSSPSVMAGYLPDEANVDAFAAGSPTGERLGPSGPLSGERLGPSGPLSGERLGPSGPLSGKRLGPSGPLSGKRLGPSGPPSGKRWYRTGDVGWLEPEGWVHLTDRSKEMIKVSGFQVAPAELETVLLGHAAVLDCAVFGIPDERAGEVPVAAVQLDPARPVAEGELEQLVADSLATYKHLRHVVVVDAIPRLPSGKALRRRLRDEWTPSLVAARRDS